MMTRTEDTDMKQTERNVDRTLAEPEGEYSVLRPQLPTTDTFDHVSNVISHILHND